MNLNELSEKIHQNAVNKGFWDNNPSDEHCLSLVICELAEAIEAERKGRIANINNFKKHLFRKKSFEIFIKDTVQDELADAFIRLLDLSGARGFSMELNNTMTEAELSYIKDKFPLPVFMYHFSRNMTKCREPLNERVATGIGAIYLYCRANNIDLEWHIEQKMKYNELRDRLHGKAY